MSWVSRGLSAAEYPRKEEINCFDLPATALELSFVDAENKIRHEIALNFLVACRVTVAADLTEATANFGAGKFHKFAAGGAKSYYFSENTEVFVLSDVGASPEALNVSFYRY